MKQKVLVAMSGGVDSSVAAYLLKEQGYEIAGVTMCFGLPSGDSRKPACCGAEAIQDARRVCDLLNMSHVSLDFSDELEKYVIKNFVEAYLRGMTPNPCVECNRYLKFQILLDKARSLGFDYLATGHYAELISEAGNPLIKKPRDLAKDQTYFLYGIPRQNLQNVLFPLGSHLKTEVREIARKAKLPVAEKPQSQDICFVTNRDYESLVRNRIGNSIRPGPVVNLEGEKLGEHQGITGYTIGQRERLGIQSTEPRYVIRIDAKENKIVVGKKEDLLCHEFTVTQLNWLIDNVPENLAVKIRSGHSATPCRVKISGDQTTVYLEKPQEAVTPGQSAVFYHGDILAGGGIIQGVLN